MYKHSLLNVLILISENTNAHVFPDFLVKIVDMARFVRWTIQIPVKMVEFAGKFHLVI